MSAKYTPGPWRARARVHSSKMRVWASEDGTHLNHAVRCNDTIVADVSVKANARLIAAAPELLDALKGLLSDIQDYQRINNLGGENNHSQVIARAAIAKAEGTA